MKPLFLEICGWGPYPEKNSIDFSSLQGGLFLITGPTGSGKTTIFDALTYALYGEVSGSVRTKESLRSDFASQKEDTYVILEFIHRNNKYRVERHPKYMRAKKRGSGMTVKKEDAVLTLPDGTVKAGTAKVNEELSRLLMIDYDQFRQISMLAQGEFQKLLVARSSERAEVFRSIFHTQIYKRIQALAGEKARALLGEIRELTNKMEEAAELSEEEDTYREAREKRDFKAVIKCLEEECREIKRLAKKTEDNIGRQKEVYDSKKQVFDQYRKTEQEIKELSEQISSLEAETEGLSEKREKLKEQKEETESLKSCMDRKKERLGVLKEMQGRLDQFQQLKTVYEETKARELQQAKRTEAALFQEWLRAEAETIHSKEKYESLGEQFGQAECEYRTAEENRRKEQEAYMDVQSSFYAGSIGILAKELKEGSPCPVCGSVSHPDPALIPSEVPDRQQVENQKKRAEEAEEILRKSYKKLLELKEQKNTAEAEWKNRQKELGDEPDWEKITKAEVLSMEKLSLEEEEEKLAEIREDLVNKEGQLKAFRTEFQMSDTAGDLQKEHDRLTGEVQEYECRKERQEAESAELLTALSKAHTLLGERRTSYEEKMRQKAGLDRHQIGEDELKAMEEDIKKTENLREQLAVASHQRQQALRSLKEKQKKREQLEETYGIVGDVDRLLKGDNPLRLTFEQFVLITYFQDILKAANIRFLKMTGGRYEMFRSETVTDARKKDNLEIEIMDYYTGRRRSVKTLSGGESFKAALCLALGLSDIIKNSAGGIEIEVLFVDEGFGSLDSESLEQAVSSLQELSGASRMIGIISHVPELSERIGQKIVVRRKNIGSFIEKL
ncbi:AAA family ATPase [Anaerostipes sp.]|uniref:AAA family ATPase n=1 Tax=Anaerostipes sp. TaxID=1872530 RepID=UPI0025C164B4|nr:SMC family ATPase [Anaerostipes sp.]MBS7007557.1 SMC family ATPase [Anaerostipes sp.]